MPEEWMWVGVGCAFGMAAVLVVVDFIACMKRRCGRPRPPVTHGKVDLFNDDGEGNFLSAKLPIAGLEQLLRDIHRGRFG